MNDTSSDVAIKVRELFQSKTPIERMKMGFSMYETSKYLVARSIHENTPVYSGAELRQELFLRFYGNDFDPAERQKIFDSFSSNFSIQNLNMGNFDHIPELEKKQAWWKCLEPLIKARLSRNSPENSKLLKVLDSQTRLPIWRDVKKSIEITFKNVKNGERILARTSEIKKSDDLDSIIDDLFGELRTVPYLLRKVFYNISYTRRDGLDFTAEFDGKIFYIETAYVQGPDFKTQQYMFTNAEAESSSIYKIRPDKLIRLFEQKKASYAPSRYSS